MAETNCVPPPPTAGGARLVSRIYFGVAGIGWRPKVAIEVNDCHVLIWRVKHVTFTINSANVRYKTALNCTFEHLTRPAHFKRLDIDSGSS